MMTLFTNLSYVTVNNVRTHCAALIIEPADERQSVFQPTARLRGFGPDPSWPVFDIRLQSTNAGYKLVDAASSSLIIGSDDTARPLFSGGILRMADGTELHLSKQTFDEQPIDISEHKNEDYDSLWAALTKKTAAYGHTPAVPILQWVPADDARWIASQGEMFRRRLSALTVGSVSRLRRSL